MGRQPCCDKVGVKKGPWTAEEDQKLVGFLLTHGHCCWRVVPKLAGEQSIAARLPGRTDNEIKNHWNTHIRKKLLRMGIDPVTHLPLQKAPAPPVQQEQEKHEEKAEPPQPQDQQQQQKEDELTQEAAVEEEQDPPLIQPQEIPAPPPPATSTCGSASSAGSASVVSPSYSSSASGVEATEWPEPMYLFGMDGIMDAGWGGLFPGDGGLSLDPFDQYPGAGFDQADDDWM
ncbi:hypothetical protein PR202_ga17269 [Eleusine coracana subsp. coracana]|uniref:Uncharacterized protein n=1 Tax=Eleusine coracana subsp. coracana TaxID=191504 RepID=A0AAV5CPQ2_ELECO|nr:hypothetical protein PR202_ga17269 [Eleusine coracana subsp. coracana]